MTFSKNKLRKGLYIFWFVWGPIWLAIILYDLIWHWHTLSNFKLVTFALQIIGIPGLIYVYYQEYKKINSIKHFDKTI